MTHFVKSEFSVQSLRQRLISLLNEKNKTTTFVMNSVLEITILILQACTIVFPQVQIANYWPSAELI
jgi:hypothetical protein